MRRVLALILALLAPVLAPAQAPVQVLRVAAAADLRGPLEELARAFEAGHPGVKVEPSFGASGTLTAQLRQGAPFDLFLAADLDYPGQVKAAGLADEVFPYATGRLAIWVDRSLGLDPARGLGVLRDPKVRRVALANPAVAPYGRAAASALRAAGLHEAVQPRFVLGENVAQAAQYCQAGAADAGLLSASQAESPALKARGVSAAVDPALHPPLRQGGVVLKRSGAPALAQAFRAFLLGPEGQAALARHGFGRP